MKSINLFIYLILLFSFTCLADITGRAIDQNQKPVPNAMVTYTSIANRLIWAYADSNGNFRLPSPKSSQTQKGLNYQNNFNKKLNAFISGSSIYFYSNNNSCVTVEIYSSLGKLICKKNFVTNISGKYEVNLSSLLYNSNTKATYIVKISSENETFFSKLIILENNSKKSVTSAILNNISNSPILYKSSGIDQIRVGRTSYLPKIVDINSYDQNVGDVIITYIDIEKRIDSVFSTVSLNELAGQCVQVTYNQNGANGREMCAGSLFGGGGVAPPGQNTPTSWADWLDGFKNAYATTPPKIPLVFGYDAVHGLNVCKQGTVLPHNIGLGATRDPYLVQKAYRIAAIEIQGTGANWTFAPCIATPRHLHWGRTYEGFGESPILSRIMTEASVLGLQGWDLSHPYSVAACAKHYAGDGGTFNGNEGGVTNTGPDSVLRQIHLYQYKVAVEKEVATIMASFSSWGPYNKPMHECKPLLTDVLKNTWKFSGWVQGDWGRSVNEAGLMAGLDMPMNISGPQGILTTCQNMLTKSDSTKNRVIDAVRRVLRIKFRMGLFEKSPLTDRNLTNTIGSQLHRDVARECVRKSLVLLKNENNTLPLSKSAKIHLIGEHAVNIGLMCGGWTISWQGDANRTQVEGTTIRQGFEKLCNGGRITWSDSTNNIPQDADVIIVTCGERPYAEGEGTLCIPLSLNGADYQGQPSEWYLSTLYGRKNFTKWIADAKATGKKVVVILISGRPMIITNEIKNCDAFVAAWLPGSEGGLGIAEVLYGDYDFSGTLPHTWPASYSQEPINDGNWGDTVANPLDVPLFKYGFGLSYHGELKAPY
jgi:beta-glucosidase